VVFCLTTEEEEGEEKRSPGEQPNVGKIYIQGELIYMAIQMNPYLNFNGNSEEAFNFYRSVFGGDFAVVMRFKDNPQCGEMSEDDKQRIMHIALPIDGGGMLMDGDRLARIARAEAYCR
jgi:predicted 3-demethylubiquinone-9 3-methyltransferase (glyoxalase superfamily)